MRHRMVPSRERLPHSNSAGLRSTVPLSRWVCEILQSTVNRGRAGGPVMSKRGEWEGTFSNLLLLVRGQMTNSASLSARSTLSKPIEMIRIMSKQIRKEREKQCAHNDDVDCYCCVTQLMFGFLRAPIFAWIDQREKKSFSAFSSSFSALNSCWWTTRWATNNAYAHEHRFRFSLNEGIRHQRIRRHWRKNGATWREGKSNNKTLHPM